MGYSIECMFLLAATEVDVQCCASASESLKVDKPVGKAFLIASATTAYMEKQPQNR